MVEAAMVGRHPTRERSFPFAHQITHNPMRGSVNQPDYRDSLLEARFDFDLRTALKPHHDPGELTGEHRLRPQIELEALRGVA